MKNVASLRLSFRMVRTNETEILDNSGVPEELVGRAYRDLARIHRWLGDTRYVVTAIRRDPLPVRRVLDIGCGTGLIAEQVARELGVEVIGVDLRLYPAIPAPVRIVRADAARDDLPHADVAFCMNVGHHLGEQELAGLIRNVGRFCRRLILVDLVRHPLPLILFRLFIAPFVCAIDAEDGQRSIRRSYTPEELGRLATSALANNLGEYRQTVAPFYIRQVIDVSYRQTEVRGEVRP